MIVPEHVKTGAQHAVPLTDSMRAVIIAQPVTTSALLFPSPVTGGRIQGWTKLVAKLQQAAGVDFRLHDLRRTCRTLMSRLGVFQMGYDKWESTRALCDSTPDRDAAR